MSKMFSYFLGSPDILVVPVTGSTTVLAKNPLPCAFKDANWSLLYFADSTIPCPIVSSNPAPSLLCKTGLAKSIPNLSPIAFIVGVTILPTAFATDPTVPLKAVFNPVPNFLTVLTAFKTPLEIAPSAPVEVAPICSTEVRPDITILAAPAVRNIIPICPTIPSLFINFPSFWNLFLINLPTFLKAFPIALKGFLIKLKNPITYSPLYT